MMLKMNESRNLVPDEIERSKRLIVEMNKRKIMKVVNPKIEYS